MRSRKRVLYRRWMVGCTYTVMSNRLIVHLRRDKYSSDTSFLDQRNIPALNRIGNPDDIIGTVLVENSEVCASFFFDSVSTFKS